MVVEFTILMDVTKVLPDGKIVTLVKDVPVIKAFDTAKLTYQQFVNSKGKILKKYTTLVHEGEYYKAFHNVNDVKIKLGHYEITGYAGKAKYARSNKNKKV